MEHSHFNKENITKVQKALFNIYEEYAFITTNGVKKGNDSPGGPSSGQQKTWLIVKLQGGFDEYYEEVETSDPHKSELVDYLDKPYLKSGEDPIDFDCLDW